MSEYDNPLPPDSILSPTEARAKVDSEGFERSESALNMSERARLTSRKIGKLIIDVTATSPIKDSLAGAIDRGRQRIGKFYGSVPESIQNLDLTVSRSSSGDSEPADNPSVAAEGEAIANSVSPPGPEEDNKPDDEPGKPENSSETTGGPRQAVWHSAEGDILVNVLGSYGTHGGKRYMRVEGREKSVPEDQLTYGVFSTEYKNPENSPSDEASADQTEAHNDQTSSSENQASDLPADLVDQAKQYGIPLESVKMAIEHGFEDPVETLAAARADESMREMLEILGYKLPPLEPDKATHPEVPLPDDLFIEQQLMGERSRQETDKIEDDILRNPWSLARSLRRPGFMGLQYVPIVGPPLSRYLLAWRIFQHDRHTRPKEMPTGETDKNGNPITRKVAYDDGILGLGKNKRKAISKAIKDHEHDVRVAKAKLGPFERKHYQSDELPSRRYSLAQEIYFIRRQGEAFRNLLLNPRESYVSKKERDIRKVYEQHPDRPDMRQRFEQLKPK